MKFRSQISALPAIGLFVLVSLVVLGGAYLPVGMLTHRPTFQWLARYGPKVLILKNNRLQAE